MDKLIIIATAIALSLLLMALMAYPLMLLWNLCLVPATTVLKEVGWLQMWGIAILFGAIIKGTTVTTNNNS